MNSLNCARRTIFATIPNHIKKKLHKCIGFSSHVCNYLYDKSIKDFYRIFIIHQISNKHYNGFLDSVMAGNMDREIGEMASNSG